ncbi:MAG TPA: TetR/AcrR family transcriptional regulator [Acidimicrobiales bacterium]
MDEPGAPGDGPTSGASRGSGRRRDPEGTRRALLDAGAVVAAERGLTKLSLDRVAAEAQVAKGSLLHHFGTRESYLVALHRSWHDRVYDEVVAAAGEEPPGRRRLLLAATRYLDICRRDHLVRAVLFGARGEPGLAEEIVRRNEQFAAWTRDDFAAMGYDEPEATARVFLGAVVEAAQVEHASGRPRPDIRRGLEQLLPPP